MKDLHVTAWNYINADGKPVIEIDQEMYHHEYRMRVVGKYAVINARLLKPISRGAIDAALDEQQS